MQQTATIKQQLENNKHDNNVSNKSQCHRAQENKKRIKSPANAKNLDANALLLQKRSKLSNTANDENIFQQFINKPCQKVNK